MAISDNNTRITATIPKSDLAQIDAIAQAQDRTHSYIAAQAIREFLGRGGDIWRGSGIWEGWRLTTNHPASSYGSPVLVGPDGTPYGPGDIAR